MFQTFGYGYLSPSISMDRLIAHGPWMFAHDGCFGGVPYSTPLGEMTTYALENSDSFTCLTRE